MNQEKIGKFIAKCRKDKNMTQSELAEKLGVTDKSIGNWENGRNMPDLSLFKPLCDELDITINELLSGERLKEEEYQGKFEENIINNTWNINFFYCYDYVCFRKLLGKYILCFRSYNIFNRIK